MTSEEEFERKHLIRQVRNVIGGLPPQYRHVLVLRDLEGLRTQETSSLTGLGERALKSRLHRVRKLVRQRFSEVNTDL